MRHRYTICMLVSALASATLCQAATYKLTAVASAAYTPDFEEEILDFDPHQMLGTPAVVQIDYLLDFEGTEGTFGGISFDILPHGLTTHPLIPGWIPHNPNVDSNGNVPGGLVTLFAINGDLGADEQDLEFIVATIPSRLTTNPALDPRLRIGMEDPYRKLGSTFLNWDGQSLAGVELVIHEAGYRRPTDGFLEVDTNATLLGQGVTIGAPPATIPEPGTLSLSGLCTMALWAAVRLRSRLSSRQLQQV